MIAEALVAEVIMEHNLYAQAGGRGARDVAGVDSNLGGALWAPL